MIMMMRRMMMMTVMVMMMMMTMRGMMMIMMIMMRLMMTMTVMMMMNWLWFNFSCVSFFDHRTTCMQSTHLKFTRQASRKKKNTSSRQGWISGSRLRHRWHEP